MTAVPARAAYRVLAKDYDAQPNALVNLEERTMQPLLGDLRGKRVIDAAAGTGRWARSCGQRGARAIAVDISPEMLDHAASPSVLADVNHLPIQDACADVTICSFALGYAPTCLAELRRITRPGGAVWVTDMHPDAIRRGWTRTFRSGSEVIEVEHYPYKLADLEIRGLELALLLEPCLGSPERDIFASLGRLDRFADAASGPAIFVARLSRT
jgi:ubiquinone/menaquinone biosynthesis C-methylase UbiE